MGAGERLRDLDSRLLPPLLRGLSRLGRGTARTRLLVATTVVSAAAVLGAVLVAVDRGGPGAPAAPSLIRVGVLEGQSVTGYVRASRAELAALLGRYAGTPSATTALVSFTAYVAPQRLAPILPGAAVHQVYARAPLRDVQTQVLRIGVYGTAGDGTAGDVVAGMREAAVRREQERVEFVRLGLALGPGRDDQRLHRAYDTAAQVAAAEAEAYRAGCPCVFAAVVSAVPAALDRIAASPEVRAVDPAPEVRAVGEADFRPPLPEQQTGGIRPPDATVTSASPGGPGAPPVAADATSPKSGVIPGASPADPGGAEPSARPSTTPSTGSSTGPSAAVGASREAAGR